MKKKLLSLLFIGALAGTLLTGCGNTVEKAKAAEVESDDELAAILSSGVLKVGVEGTYPPYTYHDESGELTGFDVEVARAIAEKLGVEVEFTEADWDSLLAGIDSGRLDTVINAVSVTEERKEKYDFAGPYFYITQQVVVKKGNEDIKEWADLEGKKVATNITSTTVDIYKEAGAEVVPITTSDEAASLVISGRADFCSFNATVFNSYLQEHPDSELEVALVVPDSVDTYAVPIKKGEDRLTEAVQAALDELVQEGRLTEISNNYFGTDFTQSIE